MSELTILQRAFPPLVAKLICWAYDHGYELTFGDAFRSLEEATRLHKPNSLHTQRLALDLNLFRNGAYLRSTDSHRPLGVYWESLHPKASWGGHFGDGNHYALTYQGIR